MSLSVFGRSCIFGGRTKVLPFMLCAFFSSIALHAHAQIDISAGNPVYTVPISVPPGIGGMVPRLALEFNAGGHAGMLGWAIKGTSVITRCSSNKMIDGQTKPVTFSQADRLCLDGQRLIQTDENGTVNSVQQDDSLGGSGMVREYRTETDSFARIRAYGMAGGSAANGPAYFKVWTKNGQIIEYGGNNNATSNAQITVQGKSVVATWAASRISDLKGNYIDFQYSQRDVTSGSASEGVVIPGREWSLNEVRYTGNGTQAPASKVVFEYADRNGLDRSESFHQGAKAVGIWQLSKVKTYVSNVAVKTLWLTYEKGPVSHRSRPKEIKECAGGSDSQKCLPPTTFNYLPEVAPYFTASSAFRESALAKAPLSTATGTKGVIVGDFFGNGRTDILRWSDTPAENEIFRSDGNGHFTKVVGAGIAENLFKSDGCYSSLVADFNGDGMSDILRIMGSQATSCGTKQNRLFVANGDGTFRATNVGIDFTQKLARVTHYASCVESSSLSTMSTTASTTSTTTDSQASGLPIPANHNIALIPGSSKSKFGAPRFEKTSRVGGSSSRTDESTPAPAREYCPGTMELDGTTSQTAGRTYHIIDVNKDGLLDIFTTELPGYSRTSTPPDDAAQCANKICTRLYLQQQSGGAFVETATNLASRSVYTEPPTARNSPWRKLDQMDVNGDKSADLVVNSGVWVSRGDGNFDLNSPTWQEQSCLHPLDFNGDERVDCLPAAYNSATYQSMHVADGITMRRVSNFNLTQPGQEMLQLSSDGNMQLAGVDIADVNGDGRSDIIRWKDDHTQNAIYLSNGDGSFTVSSGHGLNMSPLRKSDGSYQFITGDFSGNGNVEVLRLKTDPNGANDELSNVLYVRTAYPPDRLASVVTGTGLKTAFTWVPLSNSGRGSIGERYTSDRLKAEKASYPIIDVSYPMYVVARTETSDSVNSMKQTTEFSYAGLKAAYDGRGFLGFREIREQTMAPSSEPLTEITQYLQSGLYFGKPSVIEIRRGAWDNNNAQLLHRTTSIYCDTTSTYPNGQNATKDAPCSTTAKVRRPYLYRSVQEAWDLNGAVLPVTTTTNTPNANGDLLTVVTTRTGTPAGLPAQSSTRTVSNIYYPNNTAGDNWLLGQVQRSTVSSTVPNSIDSIATAAPAPKPPPASTEPPPPPPPVPVPVSSWLPAVMSLLLED